jgi:hypothetical protein
LRESGEGVRDMHAAMEEFLECSSLPPWATLGGLLFRKG